MSAAAEFPFQGDPALRGTVLAALHRVIDPEMALDIVELGLVYGVDLDARAACVRITMTSPACPVTEFIVDEVRQELAEALGRGYELRVEVCWNPPWTPERMSAAARKVMDWD